MMMKNVKCFLTMKNFLTFVFTVGRGVEGQSCPVDEGLLVDMVFDDEPLVCPTEFLISDETRS